MTNFYNYFQLKQKWKFFQIICLSLFWICDPLTKIKKFLTPFKKNSKVVPKSKKYHKEHKKNPLNEIMCNVEKQK